MILSKTAHAMVNVLVGKAKEIGASNGPASLKLSSLRLLNQNPAFSKYTIGRFTYGTPAPKVVEDPWNPQATLRIGSFCSIAENVTILLGTEHRLDWVSTYPFPMVLDEFENVKSFSATKGSVTIGNDVWIGMNAFVLDGISIGDGAVVGACSVVSKDVAPYTIVAGNPATVIRKRFDSNTIEKMLTLKWWNWSIERIKENMPYLLSNDIKGFLDKNNPSSFYPKKR